MTHTFGSRLAMMREQHGMTQTDVCAITGKDRRSQTAYEHDKRAPDANYLLSLLEHGFDVLYLLSGKATEETTPVKERLLGDVLRAVETAIAEASINVDLDTKATLTALVYKTAVSSNRIDQSLIDMALRLSTNRCS